MKIAIMIDSSMGWSEKEARKRGFYFVPIIINWNGEDKLSGIDIDLDYVYKNLDQKTEFKTAACSLGSLKKEMIRALKDNDHVIYIPISKHISSTINSAQLVAKEFKGKVTIYDSEFIGPWLLQTSEVLEEMIKKEIDLKDIIKFLDSYKGKMKGWLFPKDLNRLYASGRITKTQYLAGSLLKVTPIMTIENGKLDGQEVTKTRSQEKGVKFVMERCMEQWKDIKNNGKKPKFIMISVGPENEYAKQFVEICKENKLPIPLNSWLPAAIIGHVGIGGFGAGVVEDPQEIWKNIQSNKK